MADLNLFIATEFFILRDPFLENHCFLRYLLQTFIGKLFNTNKTLSIGVFGLSINRKFIDNNSCRDQTVVASFLLIFAFISFYQLDLNSLT